MLTLDRTRHTADRAVRLKDVQSETDARVPGVHRAACTIRSATIEDMPEVAAIYASFVEKTTVTSEIVAPDEAEMVRRLKSVRDHDLPYLVAELEGYVVGYCYAAQFRPRAGYRYTVEDSIYVRADCTGYGVGKLLLGELISGCKAMGCHSMVACILGVNPASFSLHAALGFKSMGQLPDACFKFGEWLDLSIMQCALGEDL